MNIQIHYHVLSLDFLVLFWFICFFSSDSHCFCFWSFKIAISVILYNVYIYISYCNCFIICINNLQLSLTLWTECSVIFFCHSSSPSSVYILSKVEGTENPYPTPPPQFASGAIFLCDRPLFIIILMFRYKFLTALFKYFGGPLCPPAYVIKNLKYLIV